MTATPAAPRPRAPRTVRHRPSAVAYGLVVVSALAAVTAVCLGTAWHVALAAAVAVATASRLLARRARRQPAGR